MTDTPTHQQATASLVARTRLVLALVSLVSLWIDPTEPTRYASLTYSILVLYGAYAALLVGLDGSGRPWLERFGRHGYWVDVAWFAALVATSGTTSSVFFFGFVFAVLVASFTRGYASGIATFAATAVVYTGVALSTLLFERDPEWNRLLLNVTSLGIFGYLLARWGQNEIENRRRLVLLRDLASLSNPRFGCGAQLGAWLERLRVHYDADAVVLVQQTSPEEEWILRRAERVDPERASEAIPLPKEVAHALLPFPPGACIAYPHGRVPAALGALRRPIDAAERAAAPRVAALLETDGFVSAPVERRGHELGRLFVAARRPRRIAAREQEFLRQVASHWAAQAESVDLLERLAAGAAAEERRRIARDIHDGLLQPYVGLQLGLHALAQRLEKGSVDLAPAVRNLARLADLGAAELRRSLDVVRRRPADGDGLVAAIRRVARNFAEATGMDVTIDAPPLPGLSGRFAAETLEMVLEGLSNVRRHTAASRASVRVARQNGSLRIDIVNERAPDEPAPTPFAPRSLSERAAALGGSVSVDVHAARPTTVRIEVPL